MSFDIFIGVRNEVGLFGTIKEVGNYTYNIMPMIYEAFKELDLQTKETEYGGRIVLFEGGFDFFKIIEKMKCKELSPLLKGAIEDMEKNSGKYLAMNPSNGWGSYEGILKYLKRFAVLCEQYPDADIECST